MKVAWFGPSASEVDVHHFVGRPAAKIGENVPAADELRLADERQLIVRASANRHRQIVSRESSAWSGRRRRSRTRRLSIGTPRLQRAALYVEPAPIWKPNMSLSVRIKYVPSLPMT